MTSTGSLVPDKAITVVTEAFGNWVDYCEFEVTQNLVARVFELVKVCVDHKLSEARVMISPSSWGRGAEDMRLVNPELVVWPSGDFFFRDIEKHSDDVIFCAGINIKELLDRLPKDSESATIFLSAHDEERLSEIWHEQQAEQQQAEQQRFPTDRDAG